MLRERKVIRVNRLKFKTNSTNSLPLNFRPHSLQVGIAQGCHVWAFSPHVSCGLSWWLVALQCETSGHSGINDACCDNIREIFDNYFKVTPNYLVFTFSFLHHCIRKSLTTTGSCFSETFNHKIQNILLCGNNGTTQRTHPSSFWMDLMSEF